MTKPPTPTLTLTADVEHAIRAAWRAAREEQVEPCGFLLAPPGSRRVEAVEAARNVDPRPARSFRITPEDGLAALRAARERGLRVLGIWHGHLEGPPAPSAADRRGAPSIAAPWMLIAGVDGDDPPQLAGWRRVDGVWRACPLAVEGAEA